MPRRHLALAPALLALVACAPGAAYDGLTGGEKPTAEDAALAAPRPISPISVSTVATYRPRLKWTLDGDATGAVVEMCRTRACDGDVRRFVAKGRELVVPEDLDAGIWFWRLTGRTDATVGTKTSPTWELLVRGPAANGSSDAPTGSIYDYDGDGLPDLLTVFDVPASDQGPAGPISMPFHGGEDGKLAEMDLLAAGVGPSSTDVLPFVLAGGIDVDGDGYPESAFGSSDPSYGGFVTIVNGGDAKAALTLAAGVPANFFTSAAVREAGDANGDGYGDYFVSDAANVYLANGGPRGAMSATMMTMSPPLFAASVPKAAPPLALAAAFDSNGDGFSDVAYGWPTAMVGGRRDVVAVATDSLHAKTTGSGANGSSASQAAVATSPPSNILFVPGAAGGFVDNGTPVMLGGGVSSTAARPLAFASGDFNGDGFVDVAASVAIGSGRRVCIFYGNAGKSLGGGPCVADGGADLDLGTSLTAADIEGDGYDELLVTSNDGRASGVKILHVAGGALDLVARVPGIGPTVLTTIWPGRPGKARWAGQTADATAINVYEGTRLLQTLPAPMGVVGFGRAMR